MNAMPWVKLFENMEPENVQSKKFELRHIQKSSGFCVFCGYLIQILATGIGIASAPSRWLDCASQGNEDEIERPSHLTTPSWQTLAWQKTNNEVQPHRKIGETRVDTVHPSRCEQQNYIPQCKRQNLTERMVLERLPRAANRRIMELAANLAVLHCRPPGLHGTLPK